MTSEEDLYKPLFIIFCSFMALLVYSSDSTACHFSVQRPLWWGAHQQNVHKDNTDDNNLVFNWQLMAWEQVMRQSWEDKPMSKPTLCLGLDW